jgi:alpha-amylase
MSAQGWPENYDGVMLQGFYWDSYTDTKWTTLESQADELSQFFNLIWVPNSAYANATSNNMGYHPVYWFNHRSAFGTEAQLRSMINTFKEKGVGIIEDVVINHRASVNSNWLNFPAETYKGKTYQLTAADICQDDESKNNGFKPTGAKDTGEAWAGARDLDHSGENVQENVMAYEDFLLNDLGYIGFRYDFVKGFAAKYVGLYNKTASVQFSVGECWDGNKTVVTNWINGTKQDGVIQSAAFDFPMKYYINDAFALGQWSRLNGVALCNDNNYKRYAVTFVDNHDTGRFGECPLYNNIEAANAFILMMPGTPCVWLGHWKQYPATIKKLITIRRAAGIHNQSNITTRQAKSNGYMLVTEGRQGSVALLLGSLTESDLPSGDWKTAAEGTNYKVYVSETVNLQDLDTFGEDPVFTIPSTCKVNDGETCAFFEIPSTYSNIKCWAWSSSSNFTAGKWPGAACTYVGMNNGNRVYKWTWNGKAYKPGTTTEMTPVDVPTMIIFNNGGNDKQTADLTFVNGGYYVEQGTLRAVVSPATGIADISSHTSETASSIYDLQGRRLQVPPVRGMYIVNGRKVVFR